MDIAYRTSYARSAIAVAPQIFPFTFGDEPVNSGEAISATCSILKGDFPMDITWAFNGEPISAESTDQFSITKGKRLSVLSIDAVAARHAGEYTCTASNKAGASSHTAALAVNGNIARMYTRAYTRRLDYSSLGRRQNRPSFSSSPSISSLAHINLFNIPLRFVEYGEYDEGASVCRLVLSRIAVVTEILHLAVLSRYIGPKQQHHKYSFTELNYLYIFPEFKLIIYLSCYICIKENIYVSKNIYCGRKA